MMVNWPQDLKSQETAFNRNKIEQLNLLSDKIFMLCSRKEKVRLVYKMPVNSAGT